MAYDPMEGFQIGQSIGKSKRSAFGGTAEHMSELAKERDKTRTKANPFELLATRSLLKRDETEDRFENAKELMEERNKAMIEREVEKKTRMGMQPDAAGRLQSSLEGIRASRNMRDLLFPDGTPESFQRQTAYTKSPFPFKKPIPNSEEARTLYRRAGQAIAGKLLVQSGVQTRESEYERLGEQHIANVFSNPKEAFNAINELEDFYSGFVKNVDPSNMFHSPEEMDYRHSNQYSGQPDIEQDSKPSTNTQQQSSPEDTLLNKWKSKYGRK